MNAAAKGSLLIIAAMLIFASYGLFIRAIDLPAYIILFFFQVFTAVFTFFPAVRSKKWTKVRGQWKLLLALIVVGLLNDLFYFTAFQMTTIANAVLTHYTAPILVALLAPLLLAEKVRKNTWYALALSFAGLVLILYTTGLTLDTNLLGVLFGLGSGVMYSLNIIAYKKLTDRLSVYVINFWRFFVSAIVLAPVFFLTAPAITTDHLIFMAAFGIVFGLVAISLHVQGIKLVTAQAAGIIAYIEPVAATLYAVLLLSEVPTIFTLAGGLLIIAGGYLVIKEETK